MERKQKIIIAGIALLCVCVCFCVSFVWDPIGWCWIKIFSYHKNCVSNHPPVHSGTHSHATPIQGNAPTGPIQGNAPTGPIQGYTHAGNYNCPTMVDSDIQELPVDISTCKTKCNEDPRCKAVVHNDGKRRAETGKSYPDDTDKCVLKSKICGKNDLESSDSWTIHFKS